MQYDDARYPKRRNRGLTFVLALVLAASAALFLDKTVFQVRHVTISGNRTVPGAEILSLCGMTESVGIITLNEADVRAGVESHRYLRFVSLEKHYPDSVTITVSERERDAYITVQGITYALDDEGMVLERYPAGTEAPAGPLRVTGLSTRDIRVGEKIVPVNTTQLAAYGAVTEELKIQGALGQFAELNVADVQNIYLTSTDGFVVSFGDQKDIRAKLLTVRGVLEYAHSAALPRGTLDASVPGYATYAPLEPY